MDIHQARMVLNAVRDGFDISKASICEALRLTGDLDSTWQPQVAPEILPSQQIKRDETPEWRPRPVVADQDRYPAETFDSDRLDRVKEILATAHGPIGMRPTKQRAKAFE